MTSKEALKRLWIGCEGQAMIEEYTTIYKVLEKLDKVKDLLKIRELYSITDEEIVKRLKIIMEEDYV